MNMKTKLLQFTTLVLVLAGSFSSCENDINMSKIDFSNIENLDKQPLPVIQKCVEGKWKWYVQYGGVVGISSSESTFVDIQKNRVIIDYDDGSQHTFNFTWKMYTFVNMRTKYTRWVIWDNESNQGIWYFNTIKNDTLSVGSVPPRGSTYWQFSNGFTRVK